MRDDRQQNSSVPFAVAIDTFYQNAGNFVGSGILLGPSHVLTAGHVVYEAGELPAGVRVNLPEDVASIPSRGTIPVSDYNVTSAPLFLTGYDQNNNENSDIALLTASRALVSDGREVGMVVFLENDDLGGQRISTAGYPGSFSPTPDGKTQYSASGFVHSTLGALFGEDPRFSFTDTVDAQGGQSGSGVWLTGDVFGETADLVAGVVTTISNGGPNQDVTNFQDGDVKGVRITKDIYDSITAQMLADSGAASAASLPENVIVGTDSGSFGIGGNDFIEGSYRNERLIGQGGEDRTLGGGGDDRHEGGDGVDQALFSGEIRHYKIEVLTNDAGFRIIDERNGTPDGTDTTKDVEFAVFEYTDEQQDTTDQFFVPLQVDPDDNTKLKDGPLLDPEVAQVDVNDTAGDKIGTLSVEQPAFMFDGDIDYTLTLGVEGNTLYNFVYIVDSSGSMSGQKIADTKVAYQALTEALIDQGVAGRSNFAVVDFDSSSRLFAGLDAQGAISTVNSLSAGGFTSFGPALADAESWLESLPSSGSATNIAYFLSDGQGSGASANLQLINEGTPDEADVDVRAFGIGSGVDFNSLNTIDSNSAVQLSSSADLIDAFSGSGVDRSRIDRIEVSVDDQVVETIAAADLTDSQLGLTYEGTIDGLTVTRTAVNKVDYEVFFNDGTPSSTLSTNVTTGQEEVRQKSADGTKDVVQFSINQSDFVNASAQTVSVSANDLDNTIELSGDGNEAKGFGGDDTFKIAGENNVIDGGEGSDTVEFAVAQSAIGGLSRSGDVVTAGTNSLIDVEFLRFTDGLVQASNLSLVPIVTLGQTSITANEGQGATATIDLTLSTAAASDVEINVVTRDGSARAGSDYTALSETITIAAGDTSAQVEIDLIDDMVAEQLERLFADFTLLGDARFDDATQSATAGIEIEDNDTSIVSSTTPSDLRFIEGDSDNLRSVLIERSGNLSGEDVIRYSIAGVGVSPTDADDFSSPLSGEIAFAAGEASKTIDFAVAGDSEIESDETFELALSLASGSATVASDTVQFTVLNDDIFPKGTDGDDDLFNPFGGQTFVLGGGMDVIRGPVDNFFGDSIEDFGLDDTMVFEGTEIARSAIDVTFGSAILAVDTDGDGSSNGQFTLEGDFSAGDFMAVGDNGDTLVTFETFLPVLQERQAVDPNLVNGIINQNFLKGDGATDFQVTLRDLGFAGYDNVLGVYEMDAAGNIIDTRILFDNANADKSASTRIEDVEDGHNLGFFIVQDAADWAATLAAGDTLSFVNSSGAAANVADGADISIAVNAGAVDEMVFHSFDENMNSDGLQHALSGVDVGGEAITVGFEDLTGGGDRDYEDIVFRVELVDDLLIA